MKILASQSEIKVIDGAQCQTFMRIIHENVVTNGMNSTSSFAYVVDADIGRVKIFVSQSETKAIDGAEYNTLYIIYYYENVVSAVFDSGADTTNMIGNKKYEEKDANLKDESDLIEGAEVQ